MAQKWEYCVVGPIKLTLHKWEGDYPHVTYFTLEGISDYRIKASKGLEERGSLAQLIAELGENGWELTTNGGVNDTGNRFHFLYFKRPKP